jgi:hypothetical protein
VKSEIKAAFGEKNVGSKVIKSSPIATIRANQPTPKSAEKTTVIGVIKGQTTVLNEPRRNQEQQSQNLISNSQVTRNEISPFSNQESKTAFTLGSQIFNSNR